jgi:acyl carrier protein
MNTIDRLVQQRVREVLNLAPEAEFDVTADLFDQLGLTSINLIVLITSLAEALDFSLLSLTEGDVGRIRRTSDLVALFSAHAAPAPCAYPEVHDVS